MPELAPRDYTVVMAQEVHADIDPETGAPVSPTNIAAIHPPLPHVEICTLIESLEVRYPEIEYEERGENGTEIIFGEPAGRRQPDAMRIGRTVRELVAGLPSAASASLHEEVVEIEDDQSVFEHLESAA